MYQIRNKSLLNTEISAGYVTKYQTRTDKSYYADNDFVEFEQNGTGRPGSFMILVTAACGLRRLIHRHQKN